MNNPPTIFLRMSDLMERLDFLVAEGVENVSITFIEEENKIRITPVVRLPEADEENQIEAA